MVYTYVTYVQTQKEMVGHLAGLDALDTLARHCQACFRGLENLGHDHQ